jgi:squalene-associated FAD-dependent desaturase
LRLMQLAGVDMEHALMRIPLRLELHGQFQLQASNWLPAPLHILAGLLTANGLSWHERYRAIHFMAWLRFIGFNLEKDQALADLLAQRSQPAKVVRWLWEPICLAALNTPLQTASAQVFLNVLRDSFAKAKADSDMLLPKQDLSTMLADPLAAYIVQHGGQVKVGTSVDNIQKTDGEFILSADDDIEHFSHVILATSPFRVAELTKELQGMSHAMSLTAALNYQPIYTVYLQYPPDIRLDVPMLGFAESLGQWVFDRGQLYGQHGLMAIVISAEGKHQALKQDKLAEAIIEEMSRHFPRLPAPVWHKVIAEKRATFACDAGMQRPESITPVDDLYLAGDYVAGDYPSTIEGAVRSGLFCADHIIHKIHKGALS